jgi:CspA family cold shock protein
MNKKVRGNIFPRFRKTSAPEDGLVEEVGTVNGTVKWYSKNKGFGFIAVEGIAKDFFVNSEYLEKAGIKSLSAGEKVNLVFLSLPNGNKVIAQIKAMGSECHKNGEEHQGKIVSFKHEKGYGFIRRNDGSGKGDIFFHVKALREFKILTQDIIGLPVLFRIGKGDRLGMTQAVVVMPV